MLWLRPGIGAAALAAGIVLGFILFKAPPSANERVYALTAAGHVDEAVAALSKQISRNPHDYVVYLRRALLLEKGGKAQAALTDFDTALALSPPVETAEALGPRIWNAALPETHALTLVMEIHTERAGLLESLGLGDEALADLDAAVALNGRNIAVRHQRAIVRAFSGRFDGALTDLNTILARGPNADALFARGLTKYLAGQWSDAAADFARTVKFFPDSGDDALWLLMAQLRDHQPIPLDEFNGLPKTDAAWARIDAFLSDYDAPEVAATLQESVANDPGRPCAAASLFGEWLVIRDGGDGAPAAFQKALTLCHPATTSYAVANFELQRLKKPVVVSRAEETH